MNTNYVNMDENPIPTLNMTSTQEQSENLTSEFGQNSEKLGDENSDQLLQDKEQQKQGGRKSELYESAIKYDDEIEETIDHQDKQNSILGLSPKVSPCMKIFIPVYFALTLMFFILGNAMSAANLQVGLDVSVFGTKPQTISYFGLFESVQQMWHAKTYSLAFLIMIMSGILPYVKLLGMFLCWYLPQKFIKYRQREIFLIVLDMMGKWSLLDTFFMIILIISFRFIFELKIGGAPVALNITVTPLTGFYFFMIATMMSLSLTHFIIYYHRKNIQTNDEQKRKSIIRRQSMIVGEYQSYQDFQEKIRNLQLQGSVLRGIVPIITFLGSGILIACYFVDVFSCIFKGLAGWALKDNNENTFSLIDIAMRFPGSTLEPDSLMIRFMQVMFITLTFIMPFIFQITVFFLNMFPLKVSLQKKIFLFCEILYAWSALEVFIISITSVAYQIRQFAEFMIGSKCEGINGAIEVLVKLFPNVFDLHGDNVCFDLSTKLEWGAILVYIACVLYIIQGSFVLRKIQTQLQKRLEENGDIFQFLKTQINYPLEQQQSKPEKRIISGDYA